MNLRQGWSRFRKVFLLTCAKYGYRMPYIEAELHRIGIKDYRVLYALPAALTAKIRANTKTSRFLAKSGPFECLLNHYRAMRLALDEGAENSLIMEDDISFLKDEELLLEIVESLPNDYDLAHFSHVKPMPMSETEYRKSLKEVQGVPYWRTFTKLRDMGCYAVSRKAMTEFCNAIEKGLSGNAEVIANDRYIDKLPNLKKYACFPLAVVQNLFPTRSSSDHTYWDRLRELDKVKLEDYNLAMNEPRLFIFSNVYRYKNDRNFLHDIKMLEFRKNDTVIFLNLAIPMTHLKDLSVLSGVNLITIHRVHTISADDVEYFGEKETATTLTKANVAFRQYRLENDGTMRSVTGAEVFKIPFGDGYPENQYPTTGYLAINFAREHLKGTVIPVNFYGASDNSTGKYFRHAWDFEEQSLKSCSNKIFMEEDKGLSEDVRSGQPLRNGYALGQRHVVRMRKPDRNLKANRSAWFV